MLQIIIVAGALSVPLLLALGAARANWRSASLPVEAWAPTEEASEKEIEAYISFDPDGAAWVAQKFWEPGRVVGRTNSGDYAVEVRPLGLRLVFSASEIRDAE